MKDKKITEKIIICKKKGDILTRIDNISQKNGDIYSSFKIRYERV